MNENTEQGLRAWIGRDLVDDTGSKIGRIDDIYADEQTGHAEWVAVTTGMFGTRVSFVPLQGLSSHGDQLVSPWDKSMVKDAPHAEPDGQLSESEETALYAHYNYGQTNEAQPAAEQPREVVSSGRDAMTRSEEELRVGTQTHETGRVRLRKYIETEHQTVTVPVRKERVEVIREPITDSEPGSGELSEDEVEMTISEEEVVVDTQVVAKERVRLDKSVVVEDQQVEADLRKERIETEGDLDPTGGSAR